MSDDWMFSKDVIFVSPNPYEVRKNELCIRMKDMGFVVKKNIGNKFHYWHIDFDKTPIEMKIEYYSNEINRIYYNAVEKTDPFGEINELPHNCKMLYTHLVNNIMIKHC